MDAYILVVDDEDSMRELLATYLTKEGYHVDAATGVQSARELIDSKEYDIMLLDKNMLGADGNQEGGIELLRYVRSQSSPTEVIMMTGNPTVETAIESMKLGAFDYISKPFSLKDVGQKLRRLLEYRSVISAEYTMSVYRNIQAKIGALIDSGSKMSEGDLNETLVALNNEMDRLFGVFKEAEKLILVERESLARIAGLAEELMNFHWDDTRYPLLEEIRRLADVRV